MKSYKNGESYIPLWIAILVEVFENIFEEQVVLEDPLDGLEQVGAEGQRVAERQLPPPEARHGALCAHQLRQQRHRPEKSHAILITH